MENLFIYRDKMKKIYSEYEFVIKRVIQFVFAFVVLQFLTNSLGYYDLLNLITIRLFISVVCAFVPAPIVVFIMAVVALVHLFKMSAIVGAVAAIVFIIFYAIYLRFAPKQGIYMLAIAALAPFNLHFAVAFVLGMFVGPITIIPTALTVLLMSFTEQLKTAGEVIGANMNMDNVLPAFQGVVDGILADKSMLLTLVALCIIIVLTYVISRMPFDYSWYIAIVAAAVVNVLIMVVGGIVLKAQVGFVGVLVGTIISAIVAAILQFMKCVVDYPKKEFVQFEDDDYYYYVRAIPKLGIASEDYEDNFDEGDFDEEEQPQPEQSEKFSDQSMDSPNMETPVKRVSRTSANLENYQDFLDANFDEYDYYDDSEPKF